MFWDKSHMEDNNITNLFGNTQNEIIWVGFCLFPVQEFKSSFISCHDYWVALWLAFPTRQPSLPSSLFPTHPPDFHHFPLVLICTPHLLPCNWLLLCVWYLEGQGKNNERNVHLSFLCLLHSHWSWVSALSLKLVTIHK